tara:strand:+ start:724 stop:1029 length:306 start_codon:yes stop_codon:yes gene_type:complete
MAIYKNLNGVKVSMTSEEETEFTNMRNDWDNGSSDRALKNLRAERDEKLKETDFYALSDVTMSSEMSTYRQALRDLPDNYTTSDSSTLTEDLSNLTWPTKP